MIDSEFIKIQQKISTMSHYIDSYSDVLQEQVTELAKFANNLERVSQELQEVVKLLQDSKIANGTLEDDPARHLDT